jgi:hypothetical protein
MALKGTSLATDPGSDAARPPREERAGEVGCRPRYHTHRCAGQLRFSFVSNALKRG